MEFPHRRDFFKHNSQPRSTPHKFDHDHDIFLPSPNDWIFIATALFQQMKMKGNVADNLVSMRDCSQHATD
jgi:hypothetical protein